MLYRDEKNDLFKFQNDTKIPETLGVTKIGERHKIRKLFISTIAY